MAENTTIARATHSWNPWLDFADKRRRTSDANWRKPVTWNRMAGEKRAEWAEYIAHLDMPAPPAGSHRPRVFPSLCDPFEDWQGPIVDATGEALLRCDDCGRYHADTIEAAHESCECSRFKPRMEWASMNDLRRDMFGLIDQCQNLDWPLLTKWPENIRSMWGQTPISQMASVVAGRNPGEGKQHRRNVWLMYSASDQKTLEAGLPYLLECRDLVPVLGLSLEPLLGPVDLREYLPCDCVERGHPGWDSGHWPRRNLCQACEGHPFKHTINWVIVGGESGPGARPCNIEDIVSVAQQCKAAQVPLFVKQFGSRPFFLTTPSIHDGWGRWMADVIHEDGKWWPQFKHPKGADPSEWPAELRGVQQFPEVT